MFDRSKLDKIILSDNVVKDFKNELNNSEFRAFLKDTMPQILDCENFKQNNPWHIYNVLDHILHSVASINKMTVNLDSDDKKMLAYVMLFHDIGKPNKHIQRMKNGKLIDSFFDHNKESEMIASQALPKLGFSLGQTKVMCKLVLDHDMFINLIDGEPFNKYQTRLTQKVVDDKISELDYYGDGEKLMHFLVMIGKADNQAQNPKMTQRSMRLVQKFDSMIKDRNTDNSI